jgi:hypothetical protein
MNYRNKFNKKIQSNKKNKKKKIFDEIFDEDFSNKKNKKKKIFHEIFDEDFSNKIKFGGTPIDVDKENKITELKDKRLLYQGTIATPIYDDKDRSFYPENLLNLAFLHFYKKFVGTNKVREFKKIFNSEIAGLVNKPFNQLMKYTVINIIFLDNKINKFFQYNDNNDDYTNDQECLFNDLKDIDDEKKKNFLKDYLFERFQEKIEKDIIMKILNNLITQNNFKLCIKRILTITDRFGFEKMYHIYLFYKYSVENESLDLKDNDYKQLFNTMDNFVANETEQITGIIKQADFLHKNIKTKPNFEVKYENIPYANHTMRAFEIIFLFFSYIAIELNKMCFIFLQSYAKNLEVTNIESSAIISLLQSDLAFEKLQKSLTSSPVIDNSEEIEALKLLNHSLKADSYVDKAENYLNSINSINALTSTNDATNEKCSQEIESLKLLNHSLKADSYVDNALNSINAAKITMLTMQKEELNMKLTDIKNLEYAQDMKDKSGKALEFAENSKKKLLEAENIIQQANVLQIYNYAEQANASANDAEPKITEANNNSILGKSNKIKQQSLEASILANDAKRKFDDTNTLILKQIAALNASNDKKVQMIKSINTYKDYLELTGDKNVVIILDKRNFYFNISSNLFEHDNFHNLAKFLILLNQIDNNDVTFDPEILTFLGQVFSKFNTTQQSGGTPPTGAAVEATTGAPDISLKFSFTEEEDYKKYFLKSSIENKILNKHRVFNIDTLNELPSDEQGEFVIFKNKLFNLFYELKKALSEISININTENDIIKHDVLNIDNTVTSISLYELICKKEFSKVMDEIRDQLFKIPNMIVKFIDDPVYIELLNRDTPDKIQEKMRELQNFLSIVKPKDNKNIETKIKEDTCIQLNCSDSNDPNKIIRFGNFKKVFGPGLIDGKREELPKNIEIFNYLTEENGYNILGKIKSQKSVKLFGYGFSGSGKTFTLLEGSDTDPPLIHQVLNLCITKVVDGIDINISDINIEIKLFYPHHDNTPGERKENYYYQTIPEFKHDITAIQTKINNDIQTDKKINQKAMKEYFVQISTILKKYAYILPTSNNPDSSRAFTIITIKINIGGKSCDSVQFIDLPGLEKKVDMIKDYFFPSTETIDITGNITSKKLDISLKKIPVSTEPALKNYLFGTFGIDIADKKNNSNVASDFRISDGNNGYEINFCFKNDIKKGQYTIMSEEEQKIFAGKILTYILLTGYNANNFGGGDSSTSVVKKPNVIFRIKEYRKNIPIDIMFNIINFLNYSPYIENNFLYNYVYNLSNVGFTEIITNFTQKYLIYSDKNKDYFENKDETPIDTNDIKEEYKYIFENIFLININQPSANNSELEDGFFYFNNYEYLTKQFNINNYKSPILTCIAIIFKFIDLNEANTHPDSGDETKLTAQPEYEGARFAVSKFCLSFKIMFLTMLLKYIIKQGAAIVTSLEHLLFEFLIQNPKGLKNHDDAVETYITKLKEVTSLQKAEFDKEIKLPLIKRKFVKSGDNYKFINQHERRVAATGAAAVAKTAVAKTAEVLNYPDVYNPRLDKNAKRNYSEIINDYILGFKTPEQSPIPEYREGYSYNVFSNHSGMVENIERKFLPGMNNILSIGGTSRFVNILAVLRTKDDKEDKQKRCQAIQNTLTFGETLISKYDCNNNRNYPIFELPIPSTGVQLSKLTASNISYESNNSTAVGDNYDINDDDYDNNDDLKKYYPYPRPAGAAVASPAHSDKKIAATAPVATAAPAATAGAGAGATAPATPAAPATLASPAAPPRRAAPVLVAPVAPAHAPAVAPATALVAPAPVPASVSYAPTLVAPALVAPSPRLTPPPSPRLTPRPSPRPSPVPASVSYAPPDAPPLPSVPPLRYAPPRRVAPTTAVASSPALVAPSPHLTPPPSPHLTPPPSPRPSPRLPPSPSPVPASVASSPFPPPGHFTPRPSLRLPPSPFPPPGHFTPHTDLTRPILTGPEFGVKIRGKGKGAKKNTDTKKYKSAFDFLEKEGVGRPQKITTLRKKPDIQDRPDRPDQYSSAKSALFDQLDPRTKLAGEIAYKENKLLEKDKLPEKGETSVSNSNTVETLGGNNKHKKTKKKYKNYKNIKNKTGKKKIKNLIKLMK